MEHKYLVHCLINIFTVTIYDVHMLQHSIRDNSMSDHIACDCQQKKPSKSITPNLKGGH